MVHGAIGQTQNYFVDLVIEATLFCEETKFASLFLKTVWVTEQAGEQICEESGLTKNFVQTENKPR